MGSCGSQMTPRLSPDLQPAVYAVILNWNQGEMTADCLDSLARQDYSNFHVVIVDNGSEDDSPAMLRERFPYVTILEIGENLGYSLGNNVGIRQAMSKGADYILLLNNDTEVDPTMLTRLVDVAESDPGIGMVGPTMYYAEPPDMIWSATNFIDWQRATVVREHMGRLDDGMSSLLPESPQQVDAIDTCALLVNREVISKIGLMNGDYFINYDDVDWNVRARKAGYKLVYVPTARMWHKVSAAMGQASPATTYYMTRNQLLFFWTHTPGPLRILAISRILLRTVRTVGAWTLKPQYRGFRRKRDANLLALRDFFLGRFGKMGPDVVRVCYGG
jgi:GT2 family glycosyltransferase